MVLGCRPPREPFGVVRAVRFQSPQFSFGTWHFFLKMIPLLYVFQLCLFALFTMSSRDFEPLLCLLPRPFFAPDGTPFCFLSSPDNPDWVSSELLSCRPALGFCQCPLLFTFSLISTVWVSFG